MQVRKQEACCADLDTLLSPGLFKALSDPNRITLLTELAHRGEAATVTEAAGCCPVDLSVVSRHLATMRAAGLVDATRRGRQVYYSVPVSELAATLRSIADALERCGDAAHEEEDHA